MQSPKAEEIESRKVAHRGRNIIKALRQTAVVQAQPDQIAQRQRNSHLCLRSSSQCLQSTQKPPLDLIVVRRLRADKEEEEEEEEEKVEREGGQ